MMSFCQVETCTARCSVKVPATGVEAKATAALTFLPSLRWPSFSFTRGCVSIKAMLPSGQKKPRTIGHTAAMVEGVGGQRGGKQGLARAAA